MAKTTRRGSRVGQRPLRILKTLKIDLFEEEVFVFTPKGDVISLPRNSCPVDFAYAIHSKVGDRCVGARVNGRIVPLREKLKSGDTVEVITSEAQSPRKDWLEFVVTSRARAKIRGIVKKEQRERSRDLGTKLLERELKRVKLNFSRLSKDKKLDEFAPLVGASQEEDLLVKIGYGKLLALDVARALAKAILGTEVAVASELESLNKEGHPSAHGPGEHKPDEQTFIQKIFGRAREKRGKAPVRVQGIDQMLIRFAKCCNPIPGESIVGFVSRGRGISVHAAECEKALSFDPDRKVEVDWDRGHAEQFQAGVKVHVVDKPGILAQVTKTISNLDGNISAANVATTKEKRATISFELNVRDLHHLQTIMKALEKIEGVIATERSRSS